MPAGIVVKLSNGQFDSQFANLPACQPANLPANHFSSQPGCQPFLSRTRRKMWQQHYFTPRATACHKPPESQPVCSIASLLVMRVASQPICQLANLPICQPYIRIGRQRVQQTKLQPDFTPGVKAWHMPPAGLPGSSKASLPGSQFASACQKPPESQPVCFIANLLVMRVASQPI